MPSDLPALPPHQRPRSLREQAKDLLEHPLADLTVLVLVLVSVLLLPFEFFLPRRDVMHRLAEHLGHLLTMVFVVELSARWWVATSTRHYLRRYWLDLISLLPVVRPVRLFRVFRVLRLVRAGVLMNRRLAWQRSAMETSAVQLGVLAAATTFLVMAGAWVLHIVEAGAPLAEPRRALWFATYSLVAGEPVLGQPTTTAGRTVTLLLMFGGLTLFGMFIATISAIMVHGMSKGFAMHDLSLDELRGHTLVFGWNPSGPTLIRELIHPVHGARQRIVLVTEGPAPDDVPLEDLDPRRFFHHTGDYTRIEVLEAVGVVHADKVLLLHDTTIPRSEQDRDARTVLAALTVERMAPDIFAIAELSSRQAEPMLRRAGVEEIVVGDWYAGTILGAASYNVGLVGILDEILSHRHGNAFHTMNLPKGFAGRPVSALRQHLHETHDATLIALHTPDDRVVNPPSDDVVPERALLIVLAETPPGA